MSKHQQKLCAHIPCRCPVVEGQKYCGESCEDAGSNNVAIACECDHPPQCSLTAEDESAA